MNKKIVLFICTHNSARSQMAEGLLNTLYPDRYIALSAGTSPGVVNPYSIEALKEIGIDISGSRSKDLKEFLDQEIDYIVTVCDSAKDSCPSFSGGKQVIHKSFTDPSATQGPREIMIEAFRKSRDEIKHWITGYFGSSPSTSY